MKTIALTTKVLMTDNYRALIQNQTYEEYVYIIITRSVQILSGKVFTRAKEQAHGEPDFIDQFGTKYEAKLIINSEQGKLLGDRNNDIVKWFNELDKEASEYSRIVMENNYSKIKETKLYTVVFDRLLSIDEDQQAIFFIPYPICLDHKDSVFSQFGLDFIQAIYDCLESEDTIKGRSLYFIYPSMTAGVYVLRDGCYNREYISVPELDSIVQFNTTLTY